MSGFSGMVVALIQQLVFFYAYISAPGTKELKVDQTHLL